MADQVTVAQARRGLRGTVRVPPDKSISHRALLLSSIASGRTSIENFLVSNTTEATRDALRALGVEMESTADGTLSVNGRGLHSLAQPGGPLFCRGSGTTMRLVAGLCAGQPFLSILDGTPALRRRPMVRVAEPLRLMGARIQAEPGDFPPLAIEGAERLSGIEYTLPVASAQVKSALLLAGLYADGPTTLREPAASRDHTERMLAAFGVAVQTLPGYLVRLVPAPLRAPSTSISVPGDFSSAAFFIAAAAIVPDSELVLQGVNLNPTRTGLLDVLGSMGAGFRAENERLECGEPVGDLVSSSAGELRGTTVGGSRVVHQHETAGLLMRHRPENEALTHASIPHSPHDDALIPRMIDEFPVFAVLATQAEGETRVRDAAELRVKESDRIAALVAELRRMGAQIEECADGFVVFGPARLRGARVSSHGDHRLAMSLAVAALAADGETTIDGWESVGDSFPGFEHELFRLMA